MCKVDKWDPSEDGVVSLLLRRSVALLKSMVGLFENAESFGA